MARKARGLIAVAALPLLGGCIAVAAIPVLAGGAVVARGELNDEPRQAPNRQETAGAGAGTAAAAYRLGNEEVRLTSLTELPPPSGPSPTASAAPGGARLGLAQTNSRSAPWRAFASYALEQAGRPAAGKAQSVLLQSPPSLTAPRFRECRSGTPAVIVDLDPGTEAVAADALISADVSEIAETLRGLREAGIAVFWVSQQSSTASASIATALKRSGLDPAGRDRLLLPREPSQGKQHLRHQAAESACVIAVAGDRMGDFDELFDYLRTPDSAAALQRKVGAGWFLVPPPLG